MPWLIKWPKGAGAGSRLAGRVQHIDLMPTLLDYLGASSSAPELPGRSLWRLVAGEDDGRAVVAESYLSLDGRELESLYLGDDKLVRYYTYDRKRPPFELFDLSADETESRNLSDAEAPRLDFLQGWLRRPIAGPDVSATPAALSEETVRRLRALGYLP